MRVVVATVESRSLAFSGLALAVLGPNECSFMERAPHA
jgi:hypothetical protein